MTSTMLEPLAVPATPLTRPPTCILPFSSRTPSFVLSSANKSYRHQYANIYFVRLQTLRPFVEERARRRWKDVKGSPEFVPRMLDVVKGQLCFIIGTVYMDMPLKPNVLEDLARDHSIPAPPPREKFFSSDDVVTLEDESGRICLTGEKIRSSCLVTGVILGALGLEKNSGDFEVIDICYPGMASQPSAGLSWGNLQQAVNSESMVVDESPNEPGDEWIALVSGLEIGAPSPSDGQIEMLVEYLTGEAGGPQDQSEAAHISRLVIAGNSLAPVLSTNGSVNEETDRRARRYGYDAANFSPHPTLNLSAYLLDIARTMPVHILPGTSDPSGIILPQQPMPRAMLGGAASFSSFSCETNPTYIRLGSGDALNQAQNGDLTNVGSQGKLIASTSKLAAKPAPESQQARTLLVSSGQPLHDMFKYVSSPPWTRLGIVEATLQWRHIAPTAPDTLWCHPYFSADPFVIGETPDVYVVGCQPDFGTRLVEEGGKSRDGGGEDVDMDGAHEGRKRCRIILVPGFRETGILVLVNMRTFAVRTVQFAVTTITP
ncbi:DNA polymerase subunit delta-2 [Sparassis crispa]|uniref:DNA-directed DNA polymerase n=1 Tax=Sparassis crispa TaxID=139825 RepID=A0A401GJW5_9APHY|nr:DNA polymerase subunit delta-2 [Sparassis crispa]GBE82455.1 DNA polymerase subunit delta-2 [Sparassis crispa]